MALDNMPQHIERLAGLLVFVLSCLVDGQGSLGLGGHVANFADERLDHFLLGVSPQLVSLEEGSLSECFLTCDAGVAETLDVDLSMASQVEPVTRRCLYEGLYDGSKSPTSFCLACHTVCRSTAHPSPL